MFSWIVFDLYWMLCYLECVENFVCMFDVSYLLLLLLQDCNGGGLDELVMLLLIIGIFDVYLECYGELVVECLLSFFVFDLDNLVSIYSCLVVVCVSVYVVCGWIILDMWENINVIWLEMCGIVVEGILCYGISCFCEWVKDCLYLFCGVIFVISMCNDVFCFICFGIFIECVDNILCLFDVCYQIQGEVVFVGVDEGIVCGYYQWSVLLWVLFVFEGYIELYCVLFNVCNIVELLLLCEDVLCLLLFCIEELSEIFFGLFGVNGWLVQCLVVELEVWVCYIGIDEVLEQGLYIWIIDYILLVCQLVNVIYSFYLEVV